MFYAFALHMGVCASRLLCSSTLTDIAAAPTAHSCYLPTKGCLALSCYALYTSWVTVCFRSLTPASRITLPPRVRAHEAEPRRARLCMCSRPFPHTPQSLPTHSSALDPSPFRRASPAMSLLSTNPRVRPAEAVEMMADLGGIEYPLGGTCVLFGVALMVLLEHAAHIMHAPHQAHAHAHGPTGHRPRGNTDSNDSSGHGHHGPKLHGAAAASAASSPSAAKVLEPTRSQLHPDVESARGLESQKQQHQQQARDPLKCSHEGEGQGQGQQQLAAGAGVVAGDTQASVGHLHVCVSRGPASNWLSANAAELMGGLRLRVVAYMFEMGCIFHRWAAAGGGRGLQGTRAKVRPPCVRRFIAMRERCIGAGPGRGRGGAGQGWRNVGVGVVLLPCAHCMP